MNGKVVVVTGGAGFIGSHLCRALHEAGARVISLDNYFTGSRDAHVPGVEYREGHTKDIAALIPERADVVMHLGEYSRVEISVAEPARVWDLNMAGTFGVLEYWRAHRTKLVYAGSSTKFGDDGTGKNQSPYAWTKAANTELVQNYAAWYGLPFAITYFYNVYGPGERAGTYGSVVEIFAKKAAAGEVLGVVSPGTQVRNFTHVSDVVDGLMRVAAHGSGDDYGLGNEREYSILELAQLFGAPIEMLPERQGNRMTAALSTEKARALGWVPTHSLEAYIHERMTRSV